MRPNKNLIASTTLDIMRGQGMKYVHAISGATQGVEGDLEKSRRQIKRYNKMVRTKGGLVLLGALTCGFAALSFVLLLIEL